MDEDTFQKLVERQYELLRKERMKGLEEQKPRPEENGPNMTEPSAASAAPTNHEEVQPPPQEVNTIISLHCFC